jgi:hypothetical protein
VLVVAGAVVLVSVVEARVPGVVVETCVVLNIAHPVAAIHAIDTPATAHHERLPVPPMCNKTLHALTRMRIGERNSAA